MSGPKWSHAHANSVYFTQIMPDSNKRREYNAWLRRISGDVSSMNRWAREQMSDENRYRR